MFGYKGDVNGVKEVRQRRPDIVQVVQIRHEEAEEFAATGYAKFAGRLKACLAASGRARSIF